MLTIIKAGIYTTVQDNGRHYGSHLGIPISGAMDRQSAEMANLILGNNVKDALLECTIIGPVIDFQSPTLIAIVGADIPAFLNDVPLDTLKAIPIKSGDTLSFGKIQMGCRFYIAVKGGILSEVVFGSKSVCLTSHILKQIKKGDQLSYESRNETKTPAVSLTRIIGNHKLKVSKGPEFSILLENQISEIFNTKFFILPESNRMAYRVRHSLDLSHSHSILSSATLPGTVQLTPSGELIILMRDAQTTGGYPRIFQLSDKAINDLSQLMAGEYFTLEMV